MRKIATLCTLGLLVCSSSLFPVESSARSLPAATANSADNIQPVVSNSGSGIKYAQYTATLSDNTVLGFRIYYSQAYFCGAVSSAKSITVPDTISYNDKKYPVKIIGYDSSNRETLDFSKAEKVISLTLPATVSNIYCYLPTAIKELHLLSSTPPYIYDSSIPDDVTIFVPQDALTAYLNYCSNSNDGWRTSHDVHMEGWVPKSYNLSISTAGTMAYKLLEVVNQWTDVDELTISGHLNAEDMKYFSRMTQLRKLDLSQTDITSIGGCKGLTRLREVILPSTVTAVEDNAFQYCVCLSKISIDNVESIGANAFSRCSRITSLNLNNVKTVGESAFYNVGFTSLSLPKIKSIASEAFMANNKLASIEISNVQEIGSDAFAACDSLSEVSIPNAVNLGNGVFCDISKLKKVTLSDKLVTIPYRTFSGCQSLEEINFPKALKAIGDRAIQYLKGDVAIPEGVESIGRYNFLNSTSITLPSTLTSVSYLGGTNLKDVYCNVVIPLSDAAFEENVASQATLHVPAFSVSAYKLADSWYHFNSIVPLDSKLSDVTFNNTFVLMDQKGLAEKANFTLSSSSNNNSSSEKVGHLTVATETPMALGAFTQEENLYASYRYVYDENDNEKRVFTYPYASTLISNSEITADEVTVKMSLPQNTWSFISLPFDVNVSDIEYPEGTLWVIRKYNGANRAAMTGDTWQNVENGQTLNAGEGYILHCSNEVLDYYTYPTFTFKAANNAKKNGIFAHTDVETPLKTYASEFAHNRSWNLVGNPYPAFFDTQNIEHEGVITAWNGSGYTAYSLVDDDYRLHPNEAFFVQCPVGASSMTFKAEGRTHDSTMDVNEDKTRARAWAKDGSSRSIYNLELSDAQYTDKARLVLNENAKMEYELSCDASKFMSSNTTVPQLYIMENGEKMAIDERPLSTGIVNLGVYCGAAGKHTIALAAKGNAEQSVVLLDKETGVETNLLNDKYEFEAQEGSYENRFVLTITRGTTGIDQLENNVATGKKTIYNLNGQKLSTPQSGVNIINNQKILVK